MKNKVRPSAPRIMVPSDALAPLRNIANSTPMLQPLLGVIPSITIVLDANIIFAEILWSIAERTTPGARSALDEVVASGTVVAIAPSFARVEVEKYLPVLAKKKRVDRDKLNAAWLRIQAWLRFYEPEQSYTYDTGYSAAHAADPKDVPYYAAWRQLGATAVYSRDKHFRQTDASLVTEGLILSLRVAARGAAVEMTVKLGGYLVVFGGFEALKALARAIGALATGFLKLPDWVRVLICVSVAALLIYPRSREFIFKALRGTSKNVLELWEGASPFLGALMEQYALEESGAATRWDSLRPLLDPARPLTAKQHIRAVLTAELEPLSPSQIVERMIRAGWHSRSQSATMYVRRLLRADNRCREVSIGKWTIARGLSGGRPSA